MVVSKSSANDLRQMNDQRSYMGGGGDCVLRVLNNLLAYRRCFLTSVDRKARDKRSDVIHVYPPSPIWMWKMEGFRGVSYSCLEVRGVMHVL